MYVFYVTERENLPKESWICLVFFFLCGFLVLAERNKEQIEEHNFPLASN